MKCCCFHEKYIWFEKLYEKQVKVPLNTTNWAFLEQMLNIVIFLRQFGEFPQQISEMSAQRCVLQ